MSKSRIFIVLILIIGAAGGGFAIYKHSKKPAVVVKPKSYYYALGDSVAAGVGLETASDPSACGRTNQAYPNMVRDSLALNMTSIACSGASMPEGLTGKQNVNGAFIDPQLDVMFLKPKPKLITISIGANDIDWVSFITKCFTDVCGTEADTSTLTASIQTVGINLAAILDRIQQKYGRVTPPRVLVTGYYQVFPANGGSCPDMTNITTDEVNWVRGQDTSINTAIQGAVSGHSFAKYVDIDFTGHELCTDTSWVQALNGVKPFHPTDEGQQAIAAAVVSMNAQYPK